MKRIENLKKLIVQSENIILNLNNEKLQISKEKESLFHLSLNNLKNEFIDKVYNNQRKSDLGLIINLLSKSDKVSKSILYHKNTNQGAFF